MFKIWCFMRSIEHPFLRACSSIIRLNKLKCAQLTQLDSKHQAQTCLGQNSADSLFLFCMFYIFVILVITNSALRYFVVVKKHYLILQKKRKCWIYFTRYFLLCIFFPCLLAAPPQNQRQERAGKIVAKKSL